MGLLIPPVVIRWGCIAAVIAAAWGHGWMRGVSHEEGRLAEYVRSVESAADRHTVRVRLLESRQRTISQEAHHETVDRIRRSDEHFRLRWPANSRGAVSAIPGCPGPADGAAQEPALDTPGNPGGAFCADPADSAADAIVILEWQKWYRDQQSAHQQVLSDEKVR